MTKPQGFHSEQYKQQGGANGATLRTCTLAEVHDVFRRWLGDDYDMESLDAVLAVAAGERLHGDPAWLLIISGSGNAKTETVQAVTGLGAHIVSTISSDGALLSASSRKQTVKGATGGLLRAIGKRGILVIKDFTSILSTSREIRASILAALREIHDGRWVRNVGTDGGQTLTWEGRIVVIGACTTAWDAAHSVIATMGDRFVTIRPDSHQGRISGGLRAVRNTGGEVAMRQELAEAVAGLVGGINFGTAYTLTDDDETRIVRAAELVTLARTGVEVDYRGDVIDAHDPEMPTRLAKQLTQIMRGSLAIGMTHNAALRLVIRCARDSMPQLRLMLLRDVSDHPGARVIDIRRRLQKPRATVDRTLQALHMLGLMVCRESEIERAGRIVQERHYSLAEGVTLSPLAIPDLSVPPYDSSTHILTDKSGTGETQGSPVTVLDRPPEPAARRPPTKIATRPRQPGAPWLVNGARVIESHRDRAIIELKINAVLTNLTGAGPSKSAASCSPGSLHRDDRPPPAACLR